ncbi:putative TPR repeat methyltransferase [Pseudoduganella lurida]|uniref:Putative TPR repeat methyltransferase n=1 Tax=Pseudoduganella lurida TaxID=1036180 RepID=A0A562QWJ3_9BURK|nr:tetratricopeptide repeat protein [Pseudoduganella lurida]TWI61152.1 putative TPR repeat methyltransferase [Pseudoduganella lurida]
MTDTLTHLLKQAVAQHKRGAFAEAEALYAQVLQTDPDNFDALHLTGVLARQRGDVARALALIGRAIALDGSRAIAHCNLGAALQDAGNDKAALASYERALSLQPDYVLALCNRGNALRRLGRHEAALDSYGAALALRAGHVEAIHGAALSLLALGEAEEALQGFERVLRAQPDHVEAWCQRGAILLRAEQAEAALDSYRQALAVAPANARARLGEANVLRALGRKEDAIAAYRQAREAGADAATVDYLLAMLGAGPMPQAAPPDYVAALFDQYAPRFDRHLVDVLGYRTPGLLAQSLARHLASRADKDVLDLGCGTGLCGAVLRPFARHLAGVDLSPAMLERARALAIYDALDCADVVAFLRDADRQWDVLAAADVLVYLGDLEALFAQAHRALRAGGLFAFSVERLAAGTFTLLGSGRYAHAASYIETLAARHGFTVRELAPCTLRQDSGSDVAGLLVVLQRNG